jgi:type II secretory pathway pseudopilin PulG
MEVVIVVAILAVLVAIAVPRLSRGTKGATEVALKGDLRVVRNAIEMFATEHGGTLPGSVTDGTNAPGTPQCFRWQLWYYSSADGVISKTKQTGYLFGPYLKKFPKGPLGPGEGRIAVVMVADGVPLTGEANPINPWKYDYTTGEFIFNWSAISSDGVTRYDEF